MTYTEGLPLRANEVVEYKVLEEDRDLYEGEMDWELADLYYEEEELWDEIDFDDKEEEENE